MVTAAEVIEESTQAFLQQPQRHLLFSTVHQRSKPNMTAVNRPAGVCWSKPQAQAGSPCEGPVLLPHLISQAAGTPSPRVPWGPREGHLGHSVWPPLLNVLWNCRGHLLTSVEHT